MLKELFGALNFDGIKIIGIKATALSKIYDILKDVFSTILTVEQMMADGKIDASERRELAVGIISKILNNFGILFNENQIGVVVDFVVAILNKTGVLKK